MDIFFTYLIKVNVAVAIFYMVYRTCYRRDTFFSLRRYLLLSMLTLSVLYPFFDFSQWFVEQQSLREVANTYIHYLPELTLTSDYTITNSYSFTHFLFWGYLVIVSIFLLRLFIKVLQIVWIRIHSLQIELEGLTVYQLKTETTPFSFFSWIFINPDMHTTKETHEIMTHELVHTDQYHSLDILFAEILCALCWFNPFMWRLKSEIHRNLEFIVDQQVVKTGIDSQSYQYHLLRLAYHPSKVTIANQFNVSPLKERIMMLNTKQSPKIKLTAYSLIIPLLLLFVIANNAGAVVNHLSSNKEIQSVVNKVSEFIVNGTPPLQTNNLLSNSNISLPISQNNFEINGTIVNENDQKPIQGVNIIIFGTTIGTISDADGNFRLMVHEGDSLLLSHIAYRGIAFAVSNKNQDIGTLYMKRKKEELSEVVVIGYATESTNDLPSTYRPPQRTVNQEDEIFMVVEEMPEFPGGQNELMQFIAKSIKYPVIAQQNRIQGRVICSFIVNADGSIVDAKISKGVDPSLDSEALRLIYTMPKWKPGKQRGEAVAVEYSLPINFRLQN